VTVGIAAIANRPTVGGPANDSDAIVLLSDLEYDDGDGLKAVGDMRKLRGLVQRTGVNRSGWFSLYAANDTAQVHRIVDIFREDAFDIERRIEGAVKAGSPPSQPSARDIYRLAEGAALKARGEWDAAQVGLPIDDRERSDFEPDLLICGFDSDDKPSICSLGRDAIARPMWEIGYAAVGIAATSVNRALEWRRIRQTSPLHEVLYGCYEAKCQADAYEGISPEFTLFVLVRGCEQPVPVDDAVIKKLDDVFVAVNRLSSFDGGSGPRPDWSGLRTVVEKWFNGGALECVLDWQVTSPNGRARPSSRSRSGGMRSTSPPSRARPSPRPSGRARRQPGSSRPPSRPVRLRRRAR